MAVTLQSGLNSRQAIAAQSLGGPGPIAFSEEGIASLELKRNEIIDYIRLRLGDGIVDVELDKDHYDLAIRTALEKYRQRAGNSQEESFAFLELLPETQEYILPKEIMSVRQIFRRGIGSVTGTTASQFEPFAAGYLNTYMLVAGRVGGLVNYELYSQYQEMAMRFFGGHINFNFNSVTKKLTLIRKMPQTGKNMQRIASISANSTVIGSTITITTQQIWSIPVGATINIRNCSVVGYNGVYTAETVDTNTQTITVRAINTLASTSVTGFAKDRIELNSPYTDEPAEIVMLQIYNYKPDIMLLNDHMAGIWLKEYSYSFAKRILGEVRSKYATLAGPQGGTQMNGTALLAEAKEEMDKLEEDLKRYVDGSMPLTWVIG